jgi:hypothetical protein
MSRSVAALFLSAWIGGTFVASAQEDAEKQKEMREARLKDMKQIAERFKVEGSGKTPVPLLPAPVLRFNDPARDFHDATMWAWSEEQGRPVCLLTIEQYGNQMFELISLADEGLTASADKLQWRPMEPGIALQAFPEAPKPAQQAPRRLVQMKDLLGKLAVHEVGKTGSRYELRLMPKPLHRYGEEDSKLLDGAIFAFAYGTNPELLAVMEASGDPAAWYVGFARCGTAEPHVMLGEKEIFQLPYAKATTPQDTYWNFPYRFPKE